VASPEILYASTRHVHRLQQGCMYKQRSDLFALQVDRAASIRPSVLFCQGGCRGGATTLKSAHSHALRYLEMANFVHFARTRPHSPLPLLPRLLPYGGPEISSVRASRQKHANNSVGMRARNRWPIPRGLGSKEQNESTLRGGGSKDQDILCWPNQ